ncbi:interferon-inducible GTPase-domain-containing protein [Helicostylum pulchrum]|nr:interferon-inducible GTPase-domain-containing protein [Helicostylum pulchrum]
MGQATSSPNALSFFQKVTNSDKSEYEDITHTFSKATLSTLTVPVIIIAYPALNAYAFQDMDITGHRMVDGAIGGLLGVIAWPLSPFLAIWGAVKINFKDKPPVPLPISPSILLKAEQDIKLNTVSFYNVAVCGVSGSGKSSIVNAILGYKDTESKAAKVGEVETTARPSSYQHPDLANMVIWDMPGVGTQRHPIDTYFDNNYLYAFDLLVVVLGNS